MARALSKQNRTAGRYPHKQREIARYFARAIRSGQLKPGEKIPPRDKLSAQFSTTMTTVQRVCDHLVADGVLSTISRQGTFVAEKPACLFNIGIGFFSNENSPRWRGIDGALKCAARMLESELGIRFRFYENLEEKDVGYAQEDLKDDVQLGRLSALMFSSNPFYVDNLAEICEEPDFPIYAFSSGRTGVANLAVRGDHFLKALSLLATQGCKRACLIGGMEWEGARADSITALVTEAGLEIDPHMAVWMGLDNPEAVTKLTQLMLTNREPVDAMICTDDTLLPAIISGVAKVGLEPDKDLKLISNFNFPTSIEEKGLILVGPDIYQGVKRVAKRVLERNWDPSEDNDLECEFKIELR